MSIQEREPITAREYNRQQTANYLEYCAKCQANGVTPEPQQRYFAPIPVKYGYVMTNASNEIIWKKRKRDF